MNHFPLLSRSNRKFHFVTFFFFLSSLSDSLWLGTRNRFNEQLNSTSARYTYFVPRDKAWKGLENEFPSVYKKLFMPEFQYHVSDLLNSPWNLRSNQYFHPQAHAILERHLIVSDRTFTMNELRDMSSGSDLILNTVRDQLKIRIQEHDKRKFNDTLWHCLLMAQETLFRFWLFFICIPIRMWRNSALQYTHWIYLSFWMVFFSLTRTL